MGDVCGGGGRGEGNVCGGGMGGTATEDGEEGETA